MEIDYSKNAIESEFEKRKKRYINDEIIRAKREVFLKKKEFLDSNENPATLNAFWDSALSVYIEIIKASGVNSSYFLSIIEKLDSGIPITPIIDDPDDWADLTTTKNGVIKKQYCKRYPKLFRETCENGRIVYRDNDRVSAFDHILGLSYHFGLCNLIYDEMFPIKLPYEVESENARFYIHTFLSNRDDKESEFDTAALLFIEKKDGEQIPVNRYFRVANEDEEPDIGGWVEIDVKELEERIKASKSNLELSDLAYKLGDDIVVYPDGKTEEEIK
jgi:hypothetical protein